MPQFLGVIFSYYAAVACKISDAILIYLQMEKLKDDPSIPPSVQNHFSSSFIQITENLDWFKMHFEEVNEWNVESCTQYV